MSIVDNTTQLGKTIDGETSFSELQDDITDIQNTAHFEDSNFDTGTGDITTDNLTVESRLDVPL